MSSVEESSGKRTPFSAKLPQVSLSQAISVAETLAALAAPQTPAVIAQHMGTSRSSSGFKSKLAAAGYYGLIAVDGDKRTLTDRGTAITSGDGARVADAGRDAVMSTTYGPILHSLRGRPVNEAIVSSRLQSDYNVPKASADHVAGVLIASATVAGLVTSDRFDAVAIEAHEGVLPVSTKVSPTSGASGSAKPADPTPRSSRPKPSQRTPPAANPLVVETAKEPPPFGRGVQIVVKIDATGLTPEQIAELVRSLQAPAASS